MNQFQAQKNLMQLVYIPLTEAATVYVIYQAMTMTFYKQLTYCQFNVYEFKRSTNFPLLRLWRLVAEKSNL